MTDKIERCYMPDCGGECGIHTAPSSYRAYWVICPLCGYRSTNKATPAEAISAHNTIARAVKAPSMDDETLILLVECGEIIEAARAAVPSSKWFSHERLIKVKAKIDTALAPDTQPEKEKT